MNKLDVAMTVGKEALENPVVRHAAENGAETAGRFLEETMPNVVVKTAQNLDREAKLLLHKWNMRFPWAPAEKLLDEISKPGDVYMRDTSGPSRIIFGEKDTVQHILHNENSSVVERVDHVMTAGFANLLKTDVLAKEAASKTVGQSAGFISRPIERWASKDEMFQNAIDGSRAYVSRDAANANKYTNYLTDKFGPNTDEQMRWGRWSLTRGKIKEFASKPSAEVESAFNGGAKWSDVTEAGSDLSKEHL